MKLPYCANHGNKHLDTFNWEESCPATYSKLNIVEVAFKSTHKECFRNLTNLPLKSGDYVVVETETEYNIGEVTLTGRLAEKQHNLTSSDDKLSKIIRIANAEDIKNLKRVRALEHDTMIRSQSIADKLGLEMKINNVEYYADGKKAIFYYTAEQRVDYRSLVRMLASEFRLRVEMKQIGVRQEAALVGGVGVCGRPLCCSSWLRDVATVTGKMVALQNLQVIPQKMLGQCGKLKCCFQFEVETYREARKKFPANLSQLKTKEGVAKHIKSDILAGTMDFCYTDSRGINRLVSLTLDKINEIWEQNQAGIEPEGFSDQEAESQDANKYLEGNLSRFDKKE